MGEVTAVIIEVDINDRRPSSECRVTGWMRAPSVGST